MLARAVREPRLRVRKFEMPAQNVQFYDMNTYFDSCICHHFKHIVPGKLSR